MKKALIIFLLMAPLLGLAQDFNIYYFSPKSLYIYTMGAWMYNISPDYYPGGSFVVEEESAFAPLVGIGYTVVNIREKLLINLEFDYATAQFDFFNLSSKRVNFYTFMINLEYILSRRFPVAAYFGIGSAIMHYCCGQFDQSIFPLVSSLGFKVPLGRRLLFRSDFRHYWDYLGGLDFYYSDEWWDFYWDSYIDEGSSYGSAISIGLEYHF